MKKKILKREIIKVVFPSLLALILFGVMVFGIILPAFRTTLIEHKKEMIRELTRTAWGILSHFERMEKTGMMSRERAQSEAIGQIRQLHYGNEGKDYFWINDMRPYMIMHPYRPDLEGRDVSTFTDPRGKHLFMSFVDTVNASDSGYVPYMWQWKDNPSLIVPKLSFVRGFTPWNWIIGTGIYLDDVDNEIRAITKNILSAALVILASVTILSAFIIQHGFRLTMQRRQAENDLRDYQNHLEDQVRTRTEELSRTNELLQSEIRERRQAEESLRESEGRYRDLFDNATDLIIQTSVADGSFLYVNDAWRKTLGYSDQELSRMSIADIVLPAEREAFMKNFNCLISGENAGRIKTIILAKDRKGIVVDGNINCRFRDGRPVSVQGFFQDITMKQKIEQEQQRAEKLESIGVLAGGIAHDFNNILTGILGNISLAMIYTNAGDEIHQRLGDAEKASLRARDLTQQLLTFAKGGAPLKKTLSLGGLVQDSAVFALRGSKVKSEFLINEDLWKVEMDAGQMGQVIHNMAINACQAMPDGGTIRFHAENVIMDDKDALHGKKGEFIKLSVTDHGVGILKEHYQKIFDPYFTTKQQGSGLGLAVTYSIIKNHDGFITVESELGVGTTFNIFLPAAPAQAAENAQTAEPLYFGRGKILFMDDEEIVRTAAGSILRKLGYDVVFARDGAEAVELYTGAIVGANPFSAVIMDLTIPGGMGGRETIERLLQIDPGIRAIVSSGYSQDPVMSNFRDYGFIDMVAKPYKSTDLSKVLHKVLGN